MVPGKERGSSIGSANIEASVLIIIPDLQDTSAVQQAYDIFQTHQKLNILSPSAFLSNVHIESDFNRAPLLKMYQRLVLDLVPAEGNNLFRILFVCIQNCHGGQGCADKLELRRKFSS